MDKTLQTKAWNCLPKEFKEEVKKEWELTDNIERLPHDAFLRGKCQMMRDLFGHHNLNSDAEGEEMLPVEKSRVQQQYKRATQLKDDSDSKWELVGDQIERVLIGLFGSKCLPDDSSKLQASCRQVNVDSLPQNPTENCDNKSHISADCNKPAEPEFKVGDIVRFKYCCTPHRIDGFKMLDGVMLYQVGEVWAEESDLEPYTEPKEDLIASNSGELKSQEADKHSDNILKDGFSKERRLNIAAMMAQSILTRVDDTPQVIADAAFRHADALIAESERRVK